MLAARAGPGTDPALTEHLDLCLLGIGEAARRRQEFDRICALARCVLPGRFEGRLTAESAIEANRRVDCYRFQGHAGERLRLQVTSPDFTPALYLLPPVGTGHGVSDARAGGAGARLNFVLPEEGSYLIGCMTAQGSEAGRYVLAFSLGP